MGFVLTSFSEAVLGHVGSNNSIKRHDRPLSLLRKTRSIAQALNIHCIHTLRCITLHYIALHYTTYAQVCACPQLHKTACFVRMCSCKYSLIPKQVREASRYFSRSGWRFSRRPRIESLQGCTLRRLQGKVRIKHGFVVNYFLNTPTPTPNVALERPSHESSPGFHGWLCQTGDLEIGCLCQG